LPDQGPVGPEDGRLERPTKGLSRDFRAWLSENGFAADNFGRDHLTGGSFGGRVRRSDPIAHTPVVFVHGAGDRASNGCTFGGFDSIPAPPGTTGFSASIETFKRHGYSNAELYATTWGPGDGLSATLAGWDRRNVMHQRRFIEAVLQYTGAEKISIIAHSAGVPLARKAIAGGWAVDSNGEKYFVGEPLDARVDTFIGLCGVNRGLPAGALFPWMPNMNPRTGYYPGLFGESGPLGMSQFLRDLDAQKNRAGDYVYSIWSGVDELLAPGWVHGAPTSRIPGQTGEVMFYAPPYSHLLTRDLTGDLQYELATKHGFSRQPPFALVEGIPRLEPPP
jgi:hypothetical protein